MLKITDIRKEEMAVSCWSGGTTTEILIGPKGARYAERDFLFRISTATVDLDESDFTALPDYDRIIASIEGRMVLRHVYPDCAETAAVEPRRTVHRFPGGVPTHCTGRARDLNLMLRRGRAAGELSFPEKGESVLLPVGPGDLILVYSMDSGNARSAVSDEEDFLVFTAEGDEAVFTVHTEAADGGSLI